MRRSSVFTLATYNPSCSAALRPTSGTVPMVVAGAIFFRGIPMGSPCTPWVRVGPWLPLVPRAARHPPAPLALGGVWVGDWLKKFDTFQLFANQACIFAPGMHFLGMSLR